MVDVTIRERQVFAALLEEIIAHPSIAGSQIKQDDLEMALSKVKARTLRMEKDQAWFDQAVSVDTSREDYRA